MVKYKHRDIASETFLGERVDFVAANERVEERVENLSHEKYVLEALLKAAKPDDVFWDIGACLGIHSFVIAKHLYDGQVYSFEPMHANRAVCVDNKSVNELENVYVSNLALSDMEGERLFEIREGIEPGYGRHGLKAEDTDYDSVREVTVPTKQGDNCSLEQPNIVKIDVEGASPLVLEGMRETLANPACRAVVLETHEPNPVQPSHEDFGMTREDLIDFLESVGFTVQTLEEDWHLYGTKDDENVHILADVSCDVNLVQGDISEQDVDAIINSAGTSLRMGTGVAGALREKAGNNLYYEALESGPVELGSSVVTDAHNLDAEYVIHAASMPHYGDGKSSPESVRDATQSALEKAEELECTDISIPAIGCGLGGISLTTGATIILEEINKFEFNSIDTVNFVLFSEEEFNTVSSLI